MFLLVQALLVVVPLAGLLLVGSRYAWTMSFEARRREGLDYQRASMLYGGRSGGLALRFAIPQGVHFSIWRENWFDRLGKRLGLGREVETGDDYFDHRFYFDCDDAQVLAELDRKPGFARQLGSFDAQIATHGLEPAELRARDGMLEALLLGRDADGAAAEEKAVAFLAPLIEALNRIPGRAMRYRDRTRLPRLLFAAVWALGVAGGSFLWGFCSDRLVAPAALFRASVPWSLAALCVALVFASRWIGAGARRHVILLACASLGLPGFLLAGFLAMRALDLSLPQDAPAAIPIEKAQLEVRERRRLGTAYSVTLQGKSQGSGVPYSLTLSEAEFERLSRAWGTEPERPATVLRHPGALGAPWLELVLDPAK